MNREHALLECRQRKARLQMLITVVCTEHILLKDTYFGDATFTLESAFTSVRFSISVSSDVYEGPRTMIDSSY